MDEEFVNRFKGPSGARQLRDAFVRQALVNGDTTLADKLAAVSELVVVSAGTNIIVEGGGDTDIFFLLVGSAVVVRGGYKGPKRMAGDSLGEMAALDIQSKRVATVVAAEPSVLARVTQPRFVEIANEHPKLWHSVAIQVTTRLRQRLRDLPIRNDPPRMFIGSSREGLTIAEEIQKGLRYERMVVQVWKDDLFRASKTTMESLENAVRQSDFGVLVLTADDIIEVRGEKRSAPRDNVIFEMGLLMGALGRERAFLVTPAGVDIKIPSDLAGVTPISFQPEPQDDLAARLGPVCSDLKKLVEKLGAK